MEREIKALEKRVRLLEEREGKEREGERPETKREIMEGKIREIKSWRVWVLSRPVSLVQPVLSKIAWQRRSSHHPEQYGSAEVGFLICVPRSLGRGEARLTPVCNCSSERFIISVGSSADQDHLVEKIKRS